MDSRGRILPRRRVRSSRDRDLIARDRLCGVTYRIITDNQGSVRLVVNAETGEVAQRLDYDSFGRVLRDTNPGFQPFGFQGGLYDPDTVLVGGCPPEVANQTQGPGSAWRSFARKRPFRPGTVSRKPGCLENPVKSSLAKLVFATPDATCVHLALQ